MKNLKDKTALVTGAAGGIGRALAINLAREGAHLVLADVNETGLGEVRRIAEGMGRKAIAVPCDVARADEVKSLCERALSEMGGVDVLANVAGIIITADLKDMDLDDWDRILGVNLYGALHTIRYLLGPMIERGSGQIVNVASGAGLVAVPWWGAYSTTKFALVGLTETLRAEVARYGIEVNAICPGGVKTGIFDAMKSSNYEVRGPIDSTLKYIGWTPEKMARLIVRAMKQNRALTPASISTFGYLAKRVSPSLVYTFQREAFEYLSRYRTSGPEKRRPRSKGIKDFRGQTALVTGAASGIGRALAINLARQGASVVLADVNEPGLAEVRGIIEGMRTRALAVRADVSRADEVRELCQRAIREMGGVDLLANVAGIGIMSDLKDMDLPDWDRILGVNLKGPIHTIHFLLPHLLERGSGHIVNVASGCGLIAIPGLGGYTTSKFGLVGMTESLRAELARRGIGVTAVCPGAVKTNIFNTTLYKEYEVEQLLDFILDWFGWTPERVARSILRAVRENRALLDLTPMTWAGYRAKRLSPSLTYLAQRWGAGYLSRYQTLKAGDQ